MTNMIEKIAKEIYGQRNGDGCRPWSRLTLAHQMPYRKDAITAMSVLMDPSEEMIAAGEAVETEGSVGYCAMMRAAIYGFPATPNPTETT